MPRDGSSTRSRILDAAFGRFYRSGFARVSVDDIAAAAGITKRSLYNHFESKDALAAAVLERHSAESLEAVRQWAKDADGSPALVVDGIFKGLWQWGRTSGWQGSGFSRIAIELAELPGHPARRIASAHKRILETWIVERLTECGVRGPRDLARQIMVLLEGAMVMMLIHRDPTYAQDARLAARRLVEARFEGRENKSPFRSAD